MPELKMKRSSIQYLTFEGGGGKGLVYLGAVRGLEEKISGSLGVPLFNLFEHRDSRQLKGISATSAGAITAFLLVLGMSSEEIFDLFKDETQMRLGLSPNSGEVAEVSVFEKFFDDDNYHNSLVGKDEYSILQKDNHKFHNYTRAISGSSGTLNAKRLVRHSNPLVSSAIPDLLSKPAIAALRTILLSSDPQGVGRKYIQKALFTDKAFRQIITHFPLYSSIPSWLKFALGSQMLMAEPHQTLKYLDGLLGNRGLYSGFQVRIFFESRVREFAEKLKFNIFPDGVTCDDLANPQYDFDYKEPDHNQTLRLSKGPFDELNGKERVQLCKLLNKIINDPWLMTFADLYNLTGINFVVAGSNISQRSSKYFSVFHTPDFPVVDAVSISMNFPIVFRPVYINYEVNSKMNSEYNEQYKGLWVDGGVFNNFPIHAFDKVEGIALNYLGKEQMSDVSTGFYDQIVFSVDQSIGRVSSNLNIFGMLIGENKDLKIGLEEADLFNTSQDEEDNPSSQKGMKGLFSDLLSSLLFNGSTGRLRGVSERNYTFLDIDLKPKESPILVRGINGDAITENPFDKEYVLDLLDFSSPELIRSKATKSKNQEYSRRLNNEAYLKEILINKAHRNVHDKII